MRVIDLFGTQPLYFDVCSCLCSFWISFSYVYSSHPLSVPLCVSESLSMTRRVSLSPSVCLSMRVCLCVWLSSSDRPFNRLSSVLAQSLRRCFTYWPPLCLLGRGSKVVDSAPPSVSLRLCISVSLPLCPPSMSLSFCQSVHLTVSLLSPSRYTSVGKSDTPASFDSRWSSDAGEEANNTGYKTDFGSGKVIYTYRSL